MRSPVKSIAKHIRDFFVAYPAVLSGYIIYMYYFFTTLDLYKELKMRTLHGGDLFKTFDALIWMWLLALALVKTIQFRDNLSKEKVLREEQERELELKKAQLETVHEITRALQHQINNPLTIVYAYTVKAQRKVKDDPELEKYLKEIRLGAERITQALKDYSETRQYQSVETPVGKMTVPGATA